MRIEKKHSHLCSQKVYKPHFPNRQSEINGAFVSTWQPLEMVWLTPGGVRGGDGMRGRVDGGGVGVLGRMNKSRAGLLTYTLQATRPAPPRVIRESHSFIIHTLFNSRSSKSD